MRKNVFTPASRRFSDKWADSRWWVERKQDLKKIVEIEIWRDSWMVGGSKDEWLYWSHRHIGDNRTFSTFSKKNNNSVAMQQIFFFFFFSSEVWTLLVSIIKVCLHKLQIDLGTIKSCCWLTVMKAGGSGRFLTHWIRRQPPAKCGLGERGNTRQEQCGDAAERFGER